MLATSTSFRLSAHAKQRLTDRAEREGLNATALLERLIVGGVDTLDRPGIVYRGTTVEPPWLAAPTSSGSASAPRGHTSVGRGRPVRPLAA